MLWEDREEYAAPQRIIDYCKEARLLSDQSETKSKTATINTSEDNDSFLSQPNQEPKSMLDLILNSATLKMIKTRF